MNIKINPAASNTPAESAFALADDEFRQALESASEVSAYEKLSSNENAFVAISPKYEEKLKQDPDLAEETAKRIENLARAYGGDPKDNIIVIDRRGEMKYYSTKKTDREKRLEEIEAESLKEAIKARLRRKARLDAYFKLVERGAIKRKLIEQENAKRARNKRYRTNMAKLNSTAQSLTGAVTTAADILSMLDF